MSEKLPTSSPWIQELDKNRKIKKITSNLNTDFVVVGGGIAGITSAFFTLKETDKSLILIEAGHLAHGATGHNAGQVVDYFEKPFTEMVEEYGLELASEAQAAVSSAWDLLEIILKEAEIKIPFSKFIGYAGCIDLNQLLSHFKNKHLKVQGGLPVHKVRVSEEFKELDQIPKEYADLYEIVPQKEVNNLLETNNNEYIAVLQSQKGVLNSALFVQELSKYLLKKYKDRFEIYEESPVNSVELNEHNVNLKVGMYYINCQQVVLCTNGFEKLNIVNNHGDPINKKYHDMVHGIVGYMAGYIEEKEKDPIAISYLPEKDYSPVQTRPYFYLTRRNHNHDNKEVSLVCIGGPESVKKGDRFNYIREEEYPDDVQNEINNFLHSSYERTPEGLDRFHFKWHGLMGYTESGIRCVGYEPANERLLYNLGCNGVGILPSIYGAKKISKHVAGEEVKKSIFDPHVQRNTLVSKNVRNNIKNFLGGLKSE